MNQVISQIGLFCILLRRKPNIMPYLQISTEQFKSADRNRIMRIFCRLLSSPLTGSTLFGWEGTSLYG